MRIVVGWIAAVIVGVVLGGAVLAWFDQQAWVAASGGTLSIGERAAWAGQTIYGLVVLNGTGLGFGLYPVLVAIAFLIGFGVAALVKRLAPGLRFWWYAGAGAVALITIFIALKAAVGIMPVPGARTMAGVLAQGAVGFVAGAVFAVVSRRRG